MIFMMTLPDHTPPRTWADSLAPAIEKLRVARAIPGHEARFSGAEAEALMEAITAMAGLLDKSVPAALSRDEEVSPPPSGG